MAISNAQPIQFWPIDEDTFNEKEVCGIEQFCFCWPIESDDPISVVAPSEVTAEDYSVVFTEEDGTIVFASDFDSQGITEFQASEVGVGNFSARILASDELTERSLGNPDTDWTLTSGPGTGLSTSTIFGGLGSNTIATWSRPFAVPGTPIYYIPVHITISTGLSSFSAFASIQPAGGNLLNIEDFSFNVAGNYDRIAQVQSVSDPQTTMIAQIAVSGGDFTNITVIITIDPDKIIYVTTGQENYLYKSDCLSIQDSQDCTGLITYSNNKDFAGLPYENISPGPEFKLRIPMIFFREEFPQEDEVHPKSDDTWIRLSSRIEKKKLLEVGYLPDYGHEKLILVLMHDNIEIDGLMWKKRDPYNKTEVNKRYPMRMANVLLTDKNYIKRNLI